MTDSETDLLIARAEIERLQAQLAEYGEVAAEYGIDGKAMLTLAKSQIRTAQDNIKLREQLAASQRRESAAVDTLTKLLKHANDDDDICAYCNNQIICNGKSCESYREGVGDVDGNYPDWEWTCEDFDYGTCFKMQNTPCNGCFYNEYSGFEWRGPQEAGEESR